MNWRPIKTAPRDGTKVLLKGFVAGEIFGKFSAEQVAVGYYTGRCYDYPDYKWSVAPADAYGVWMKPSHWMPIP